MNVYRSRAVVAAVAVVLAAAVSACVEPQLAETTAPEAIEAPEVADDPPVDLGPLHDEISAISAVLAQIDDALVGVSTAPDVATARQAGDVALAALVTDDDGRSALLPHTSPDRLESLASSALMVTALAVATEVGGTQGGQLRDVISATVAGDLGGWQRDAAGMISWARQVADLANTAIPLDQLQTAVLELPGDGLRSVAWTMLLADAADLDAAHTYAERARAHIQLMQVEIDQLGAATPEHEESS